MNESREDVNRVNRPNDDSCAAFRVFGFQNIAQTGWLDVEVSSSGYMHDHLRPRPQFDDVHSGDVVLDDSVDIRDEFLIRFVVGRQRSTFIVTAWNRAVINGSDLLEDTIHGVPKLELTCEGDCVSRGGTLA